jgi:beta-mannosidase
MNREPSPRSPHDRLEMIKGRVSKRGLLLTSAAAAACAWAPLVGVAGAAPPVRKRLSLNGAWEATRPDAEGSIAASVPGCIHTDLLASEKMPDPFDRENERLVQWIGETDWIYRRSFEILPAVLSHDRVLLRCEGLDTLATIRINGVEIGRADNMFRIWEFDTKPALRAGANSIEIAFASPLTYMRGRQTERMLAEWVRSNEPKGRAWVRKEPCGFGWDWAPVLVTCGIWRNIAIEAFDEARLEDVLILQDHSIRNVVRLDIAVSAETTRSVSLHAKIFLTRNQERMAVSQMTLDGGKGSCELYITDPKLWWPANMGEQPLYEVKVDLFNQVSNLLDRASYRIGLRRLQLLEADGENSLRFAVNGIPFFAKGANLIPADVFPSRVTPEVLRRCVSDAVAVNMNSLRFWAGGYYEDDELFAACDEAGVCVWLDFKFACSSYPVFDPHFLDNVRLETRDNIRRLRHHPCIAVWCGNNEVGYLVKDHSADGSMSTADYNRLFKQQLAVQMKELAPQADYVAGSPGAGDTHFWEVWHGGRRFEAYRSCSGFVSEFGFQSFPEPKTVRAYTSEPDRASLMTPAMQWHQRSDQGNQKILDMISNYFRVPKDVESALWLSQIVQGLGIKIGVEHLRRTMPKSMGSIYWQYNDCWPGASWSSVDYYGRWKALHYMARHFYAPLMVSALEDTGAGSVALFVTSDLGQPCLGNVLWNVTDLAGRSLARGSMMTDIAARNCREVYRLDLRDLAQSHGTQQLLVWVKLTVDQQIRSENLAMLVLPKDLQLSDPGIVTSVGEDRNGFRVTLKAGKPALWTWLELTDVDARLSDNFMHLGTDSHREILVHPDRPMTKAEFSSSLRVRSLYDTYRLA